MADLERLRKNREALLLAEISALIHNVGKMSEEFLRYQAGDPGFEDYNYQAVAGIVAQLIPSTLTPQERQRLQSALDANQEPKTSALLSAEQKKWLTDRVLDLPAPLDDHKYALGDFIEFQDFGWYKTTKGGSPPRITLLFPSGSRGTELLEASHNAASGVEKEGAPKDEGKQIKFPLYLATAFGLETPIQESNLKTWRDELLDVLRLNGRRASKLANLEKAVGDTRRPINEVLLSDLSFSVAALFKSALAQAIITQQWTPRDNLRWRILRVNLDMLGLYAKAIKIADLLGYQRAVEQACGAVKQLVEEEYPLGNEVYRDTTGFYFTFPDLALFPELEQEIRRRVEAIEPELAPRIVVDPSEPLKTLLSSSHNKARQELAQPMMGENLSPDWQRQWDNLPDGKWELCPVCRLRPMREKREVCEHCERRRQSRVALWERDPSKTIWLDEIADHNDRVALIVGKFGLDDWLSGDLVQTMLVKAVENNPDACVPKNPSPARLRRVWETCRRFWTETVGGILEHYRFGGGDALRCTRVAVVPDSPTRWQENVPYDGTINGKAVSLLWQQNEGRFITIGNLQLGVAQARDETGLVGEWHGRECIVTLPDRPGRTRTFTVKCVELLNGEEMRTYAPYLTLLESPDRCLTLVPAAEVLDIAEQIKDEYEKQMGKVQNRLPLFLGVVFFQRKLPLMAVMDTARRMLEQVEFEGKTWKITQVSNGSVAFENSITCDVLTTMGDGSPDHWYPYFFVEGDPRPRQRCFRHNGHWLVHVSDLHVGDTVCVTPSRFAYIYLEHTAQRFRFDPNRDVMLLDELPRLRKMWQDICKPDMTDTKLQAIHALFESKRQAWGLEEPITDETFRHLVKTTLNRDKVQGVAVEDVLNGCFRRCVDLHWHILKCRVSDEQKKEEQK